MTVESRNVAIRTLAAAKGCPANIEAIVLDRVKYSKSGISAVALKENHLNRRFIQQRVQAE